MGIAGRKDTTAALRRAPLGDILDELQRRRVTASAVIKGYRLSGLVDMRETLNLCGDSSLLSALQSRGGAVGALGEAGLLSLAKAGDYNSGLARDQYFPLGLASYAQMLHTKSLRLVSLATKPSAAAFESTRDTGLDTINYASFLVDWLTRQAAGRRGDAR